MARPDIRHALKRNLWHTSLTILALLVATGAVRAGDQSLYDIIGYSPDSRYFAFEEFGIQDGSGFAYSSIYVIDLIQDRFVLGTPIQKQAADEGDPLHDLRQLARTDAEPRLNDLETFVPAQIAAAIGDAEPGNDGQSLSFGIPSVIGNGDSGARLTLTLSTFGTQSTLDCRTIIGGEPLGFALSLEDFGTTRELHRDAVLPRSRGCALAYKISAVFIPFQDTDISHAVALISVFSHGFEGPNRRFIIVPLSFSLTGMQQ